ncbi:MAG: hypothetical protein JETCAE01_27350 [Anaerolineaceae bacterium]|nr:MAG: hypothetical protein JETCAE01_27350 [Anaerolineaceae bacterium]
MNISLEKIAPPVAFVIIGFALLVIGATGVVPIGNPQIIISNPTLLFVFILMGILLIFIAPLIIWLEARYKNQKNISFVNEFYSKMNKSTHLGTYDVNLSGKWKVFYGNDIKKISKIAAGSADIAQKNMNITIEIRLHLTRDKRNTERVFENFGVIENRQIVTWFRATYPVNSFMIGAMVLRPGHDGKVILGGATFIDDDGKVFLDEIILLRD